MLEGCWQCYIASWLFNWGLLCYSYMPSPCRALSRRKKKFAIDPKIDRNVTHTSLYWVLLHWFSNITSCWWHFLRRKRDWSRLTTHHPINRRLFLIQGVQSCGWYQDLPDVFLLKGRGGGVRVPQIHRWDGDYCWWLFIDHYSYSVPNIMCNDVHAQRVQLGYNTVPKFYVTRASYNVVLNTIAIFFDHARQNVMSLFE